MDDVPDMDDLLDELEADVYRSREVQKSKVPQVVRPKEDDTLRVECQFPTPDVPLNPNTMITIDVRKQPFKPTPIIQKMGLKNNGNSEHQKEREEEPIYAVIDKNKKNGHDIAMKVDNKENPVIKISQPEKSKDPVQNVRPAEVQPENSEIDESSVGDTEFDEICAYLNGFSDKEPKQPIETENVDAQPGSEDEDKEVVRGEVASEIEMDNHDESEVIEDISELVEKVECYKEDVKKVEENYDDMYNSDVGDPGEQLLEAAETVAASLIEAVYEEIANEPMALIDETVEKLAKCEVDEDIESEIGREIEELMDDVKTAIAIDYNESVEHHQEVLVTCEDNIDEPVVSIEKTEDELPNHVDQPETEEVVENIDEESKFESDESVANEDQNLPREELNAVEEEVGECSRIDDGLEAIEMFDAATSSELNVEVAEIAEDVDGEEEEDGAETAIEVANSPVTRPTTVCFQSSQAGEHEAVDLPAEERVVDEHDERSARFDSIATVHLLSESDSEEDSSSTERRRRLTESELLLGKTVPYWIPDTDCTVCMLCSTKFTIITRRHHCRACGRVLCGTCCNEKAILQYTLEEGKKPQASRVCHPCARMLERIEQYENEERQRIAGSAINDQSEREPGEEAATSTTARAAKGVLKVRSASVATAEASSSGSADPNAPGTSTSESLRRSVVFRDGVRPGSSATGEPEEERTTTVKPKKKSRKRHSVVRRIAELRMEDELLCVLPNATRKQFLIDYIGWTEPIVMLEMLRKGDPVTVLLKKNLDCCVQLDNASNQPIWTVATCGFAQIGLDELFFAWALNDAEKATLDNADADGALAVLPLPVLHRISQIYSNSTDPEYAGVRRVATRLSRIHSVPLAAPPLTKHILFFQPTLQDFSNFTVPSEPFLVACFLHDHELPWVMACPDRVLLRLGLKYGCYPTPLVNYSDRPSVYSQETSNTVLKVFTDFRSWTFRMRQIIGCTASLENNQTIVRIPRAALADLREVISWNRSMLAWCCDVRCDDDSHLVCDESDGIYSTQVLARFDGVRKSTGASFVVLDGGLKSSSLQVSVVEDGVAIRVQAERLVTILEELMKGHDVTESDNNGTTMRIEFVDDDVHGSRHAPRSLIDGLVLSNKYQYGLSIERALTQVLQVQGVYDRGIRLSHVYNINDGRFSPEEEPKIFGLVEIVSREIAGMLEPFLQMLIAMRVSSISVRLLVTQDQIEYDVSAWPGLDDANSEFRQSLDSLIPMLYNAIEVIPNGFEVEMVLSIVSTKPLAI